MSGLRFDLPADVDLPKHGAMAFARASGADPQETFKAVVAGFTAEMQRPTDASPN